MIKQLQEIHFKQKKDKAKHVTLSYNEDEIASYILKKFFKRL